MKLCSASFFLPLSSPNRSIRALTPGYRIRSLLTLRASVRVEAFSYFTRMRFFNGRVSRTPARDLFHPRLYTRLAPSRASRAYLERDEAPASPRTHSPVLLARARARRITRCTELPLIPFPSLWSLAVPPSTLASSPASLPPRRIPLPFPARGSVVSRRPFPFLLLCPPCPSSSPLPSHTLHPAFSFRLPPVLEASWSCYNPESADGRPMYGSLFYAACIALRCTPRERASERTRDFSPRCTSVETRDTQRVGPLSLLLMLGIQAG